MRKVPVHFVSTLCLASFVLASTAETQKVRVDDAAAAKTLLARGGQLIADYDSFKFIEVDSSQLAGVDASHVQVENSANVIALNAVPLDTRVATVKARRKAVAKSAGNQLHLVQFAAPVKPEWRDELEKTGVKIVTYIPENAYLVYGDTAALTALQSWAANNALVQWEGDYSADLKIHPAAQPAMSAKDAVAAGNAVSIQLVDDSAANSATLALIDQYKLAPVRQQYKALGYQNLVVAVPAAKLAELAAQPDVVSILPYFERHKLDERQDQIVAGNIIGNLPSAPGYLAWLTSKGFTQAQFSNSGFVVDVSDSGIDNGTTSPGHFGLYIGGNPASGSRVVYNRLEGTANSGSTLSGCDGHGNLNTHIIAGYNDFTTSPHVDSTGYRYGLGVCPFVKVGSSVIFDPDNFTSPDYPNLQSQAYNSGARISANSWGGSTAGAYDSDAQTYDALVRDAQPAGSTFATAGNQPMVIVFAGGNDGPAASTVGSPGTAKNVIVVGAAENVRSMSTANGGNNAAGNDGCATPDTDADSLNDIVDFSSRGPCTDGRQKPDICAPGTHITGGVGQSGTATTNGTGSALSCFTASGVCGRANSGTNSANVNNYFPGGQQFYTESSGTSHSTPCVAGGCALVRQWFINNSITPPSPAMTKAWLMNSTRYLTGASAGDTLPSSTQGMGEMDLGRAFDNVSRVMHDQVAADKFTATGQTRTLSGAITDPTKPFRVTLAWTDAPGATSGNSYNNNLDLTVTIGGNTYKGNVFSGGTSVTGGSADAKNNVESVFLPAGTIGSFSITVTAANINSDGVPNEAPSLDQDYALIAYNAVIVPAPAVTADTTTLAAEGCAPTNGVLDTGETVTLQLGLKNLGTANTANVIGTLLATNGVGSPSAAQTYGTLTTNGETVTKPFTFNVTATCGGTVTATLQLQDGVTNLGLATFALPVGQLSTNPVAILTENFDSVTAPALPAGWTTTFGGSEVAWVSKTGITQTAPNAMFSGEGAAVGSNQLVSATIALPAGQSQLTFRNFYNLEASGASGSTTAYDGGVLEIAINGGPWQDIIAAGGTFVSGGYNKTISPNFQSPLPGRSAWSGNSAGFTNTVINLPANATSESIQFRWRCASDQDTVASGTPGWYVDSVAMTSFTYACCTGGGPIVAAIAQPDSQSVNVSWNAAAGTTYRVQYMTDITNSTWFDTTTNITATGSTVSTNLPVTGGQRFYRITTVP